MKKHMNYRTSVLAVAMLTCLSAFGAAPAFAQDNTQSTGLVPAENTVVVDDVLNGARETHPPLRLTPDKSEIINLDSEVERVIIGNDMHVNVFLDTARRIIVVPRVPGATHFTLMGPDGKIVMQRHVIVASPQKNYLRIRRTCSMSEGDCAPTQVYYCPGMCHEIALQDGSSAAQAPDSTGITLSFPSTGQQNNDDNGGNTEGSETAPE